MYRMLTFLLALTMIVLFTALKASAHDGYDHYKNPVTGISCRDHKAGLFLCPHGRFLKSGNGAGVSGRNHAIPARC